MKRALPICLAASVIAAESTLYHVAPPPETQMHLFVEKTGLLSGKTHHFVFDRMSGAVDMAARTVSLEIDAASIRCLDTWVSEKDRRKILKFANEEMLASRRYPVIRFRSEHVKASGTSAYEVSGVLTIREVPKPVQFVATRLDSGRFSGEARIRMKDFGLSPPSAALGLIGTKDEMRFTFELGLMEVR